jgi:hypothetical protein
MPYEEVPFSDLLHHPAATAHRLNDVRALRLRRRDASDLLLMRADQMDDDATVIDFTARMLAGLVRTDNIQALADILPDALPWAVFLPADDLVAMLVELVQVARGAAAIENLTPVAVLLTQWRHSAEVYADPELFAALSREPEGDLGRVPVPEDNG